MAPVGVRNAAVVSPRVPVRVWKPTLLFRPPRAPQRETPKALHSEAQGRGTPRTLDGDPPKGRQTPTGFYNRAAVRGHSRTAFRIDIVQSPRRLSVRPVQSQTYRSSIGTPYFLHNRRNSSGNSRGGDAPLGPNVPFQRLDVRRTDRKRPIAQLPMEFGQCRHLRLIHFDESRFKSRKKFRNSMHLPKRQRMCTWSSTPPVFSDGQSRLLQIPTKYA